VLESYLILAISLHEPGVRTAYTSYTTIIKFQRGKPRGDFKCSDGLTNHVQVAFNSCWFFSLRFVIWRNAKPLCSSWGGQRSTSHIAGRPMPAPPPPGINAVNRILYTVTGTAPVASGSV